MSALREIRERIDSVQNTLKITNAMYMISSAKLTSARKALADTEPYFYALQGMFSRVLRHLPEGFVHPYLDARDRINRNSARRAIICVTADKGLAGSYNHDVLKLTMDSLHPESGDRLFVVGEVGRQYFLHAGVNVDGEFRYTAQKPTLARARHIAALMLERFRNNDIDEVYIIYTRMRNSLVSEAEVTQLLPLIRLNNALFHHYGELGTLQENFNLEPDPALLLDNIVPDYLNGYIYSALVESYCAEQSARMQAMDAASRNGQKLIRELKMRYNHERQAQITQEITEVAAGARARAMQAEIASRGKEVMTDAADR